MWWLGPTMDTTEAWIKFLIPPKDDIKNSDFHCVLSPLILDTNRACSVSTSTTGFEGTGCEHKLPYRVVKDDTLHLRMISCLRNHLQAVPAPQMSELRVRYPVFRKDERKKKRTTGAESDIKLLSNYYIDLVSCIAECFQEDNMEVRHFTEHRSYDGKMAVDHALWWMPEESPVPNQTALREPQPLILIEDKSLSVMTHHGKALATMESSEFQEEEEWEFKGADSIVAKVRILHTCAP